MKSTLLIARKRTAGLVEYNDGDFAEIQVSGIEGIEKDLYLEDIQLHREDTSDTQEVFRQRFPVGMWLDILRIIRVAPDFDSQSFGGSQRVQ